MTSGGGEQTGQPLRERQATAASFDREARSATVLLDDGSLLAVPARAVDAAGIRLLRAGQRVRVRLLDDEVVAVSLLTLPLL